MSGRDADGGGDPAGIEVRHRPPEEVFGLLGNELRVAILRALAEDPNEPVTFSALRERVGERDSGKFNYHLRKLDGVFVVRGEEGYELTLAGRQLVGAIVAGTYTADATVEPVEVDDPCPTCGASPLVVTYADDRATLACPACEEWLNAFSFPAGTLDQYDRSELPAAFDRWMYALFQRIDAGFCANCAGRLSGRLDADADPPAVRWRCERCGDEARTSAAVPVIYHPLAQGFLHDHDVDPASTPSWRLASARDVDFEPTDDGVVVRLSVDGDVLSAVVTREGAVVDVERSDR
jgi:DNA-binding transcriptional ArsR family regulator